MDFLFKPVDNARLILFRVFFGLIMFIETLGSVLIGWVDDIYIEPEFTFSFIGFEWLQPLPGYWMYGVFLTMALLSLCMSAGYHYRLSTSLLWLGWSYVYIIHKASYNNHHYLMWLLLGLMCLLPANADHSLDVRLGRQSRRKWCRQWQIHIFWALYLLVYTYAAIAKLYPDWYRGIPLSIWFEPKADYRILGPVYGWSVLPVLLAWGGILFDLLIIPCLLWKPTRKIAFFVSLFFHLTNSITFQIGTFPYLMIASGVLFFPSETMRKYFLRSPSVAEPENIATPPRRPRFQMLLLAIFLGTQTLLPLRHLVIPGNVFWTEEGHRLSWRMMLKTKSGYCQFELHQPDGTVIGHDPTALLTSEQYSTMATHPDMIWQYSQRLKKEFGDSIKIFVRSSVSLNRGQWAPLIRPEADMAKARWHIFRHENWLAEFPGWRR